MRPFLQLFLFVSFLGLSACHKQPGVKPGKQTAPVNYSDSYLAPHFVHKDRINKIGKALIGAHRYYKGAAELNHLPGLAYGLVVDDSLVFYGACGISNLETGTVVTEHTLFRIASMSKSFTAMAILMLRDEGRLSLSDPVSLHIPELKNLSYLTADAPPISIANLLSMTAGFPEDNPWGDRFLDISDEALIKQVEEGISFSNIPSMNYEYSNLGYGLLGQVISKVAGMPYQEYITRKILHSLGMTHTYWEYEEAPVDLLALGYRWVDQHWHPEALLHDGAFGAMGGLITSIADFSKYVAFHLSAWPPRSDPETGPLKRSSIREMHMMNNPRFYWESDRFGDISAPIMRGYGYGLVSMKDMGGIVEVGHNGGLPGFGSSYMFYPQYGIGIMAFSNLTYVGGQVRSANYQVMNELIGHDLLHARTLPASEILELRKKQVKELLFSWDPELEQEILAANFYMDISREKRIRNCREQLEQMGKILSIGPLIPENQLRGSFILVGENQILRVYFTLSPEPDPRVQWLTIEQLP